MGRPLSVVGVIGLGTVGSALTALLSRAGVRVVAVEGGRQALRAARDRLGPIENVVCAEELPSTVDIVIEALPESAALKTKVLRRVHARCAPETVFVTTTTGHSVADIAAGSGRPDRTLGLHWGEPSPAPDGLVLELVRAPGTGEFAVARAGELIRLLGGTAVRTGGVGGALILGLLNGAARMYDDGYAGGADIDTAMRLGCGLPVGPLARLDRIGLDTARDSLRALHDRTGDDTFAPAPVLDRLIGAGRLGLKIGRGFHSYPAAEARPMAEVPPGRPVRRIGIVGSGQMASGIAEVCARAGLPTTVVGRTEPRVKEALAAVEASLDRRVRRGKVTPRELAAVMDRLTGATELDALGDCDLVVEAVVEDLTVKRAVFGRLDRATPPGTVLATTTSSLPVLACATATGRPADVVGMHFFNPAPVMRLVEVAPTRLTAPAVTATAHALATALGKHAIGCGDRTGFIVNALLIPYLNHAVRLHQDGRAGVDDIDAIMTEGYGMPVGPLALLDLIGLDVALAIQQRLYAASPEPRLAPATLLTDLVAAGHLGRKTGHGFRTHTDGETAS
ncbi:3-hydroxyacyl-CoA dehydrogenase family protein [Micromonospora endolithica]|uniref:3-hydroxyacyl-CoA dehydrogenase n=1 Tax=Micromonospora endolithica TaxID=230091 RepID=A0A3A9ZGN9_9ACTN|nr:3-hydroxyacyl-CoA dehydrogenase [Micromonospora endolithica]RKN47513.1 3-hydroxyacyl-CoA dehydrogenase [Micromonospora endolithica]TWJ21149.1 3-hydroxybutyryl-CoA dehydrogenase [Micromonospora endolithica]